MPTHTVSHDTFVIERTYPATPERVFAAWSEPTVKARWFSPDATEHALDFRVGGRERNRGGGPVGGPDWREAGTNSQLDALGTELDA